MRSSWATLSPRFKKGIFYSPPPPPSLGTMGGTSPCASCKLLRRRCAKDCIFAPYFPSDEPQKFAIVHKVFGASNVSKMLQEIGVEQRGDAVCSLVFEANARMKDPVYGCVGAISYLQSQVSQLQMQLAMAQAEILCIQMQQNEDGSREEEEEHLCMDVVDHKPFVFQNNSGATHFFNFSSPPTNVVKNMVS